MAYRKKGKGMMSSQEERERNYEHTGERERNYKLTGRKRNGIVSLREERERNDELTGRKKHERMMSLQGDREL